MNADGTDLQQLTHGHGDGSPTWSPDGSRIAFVRDQGTALCTIRADGSHLRVIASRRGYYQHPRWSPTSDLIVYQSRIGTSEGSEREFLIHADGTGEQVLPAFMGPGSYPAWSPDGNRLVYSDGYGLAILDLRTDHVEELPRCHGCYWDWAPAWSPDGRQIAFIRDDTRSSLVYVVDLATRSVERIGPADVQQFSPAWRP
jgi:TolB protein